MTTVQREKVAKYVRITRELRESEQYEDYAMDTLTVALYGFIYTASKEEGEFEVYVKRPTFFDWLFRRTKTIKVPYTIRQLIKTDLIPESLPTIDIRL